MTTRTSRTVTAGALIGVIALGGCSTGDSGDGDATTSSSTGGAAPSESSSVAAGGSDNGAQAAGVDLENPPKAIASVTIPGEPKGDPEKTLVELVGLQERGQLLLAVFRVTPEGTKEKTSLYSAVRWGPALLDPVNLKLYSSVNEVTTGYLGDLVMNEPNYVMAGFAIPENTETIDIDVSGGDGIRMEDVKLP